MSRKRYKPEQIIGKLREAEVALSAINAPIKRVWKCFTIQIIAATISGLGIIVEHGKLSST